jgi:hypothetical protein
LEVEEFRLLRIFGPNREELAGILREWHEEELHDLDVSPNIIRVQGQGGSDGWGM